MIKKQRKQNKRALKEFILVSETLSSGTQVEYSVPAEDYKNTSKAEKAAIFPTWSATKANKYYRADCYDAAMKQ